MILTPLMSMAVFFMAMAAGDDNAAQKPAPALQDPLPKPPAVAPVVGADAKPAPLVIDGASAKPAAATAPVMKPGPGAVNSTVGQTPTPTTAGNWAALIRQHMQFMNWLIEPAPAAPATSSNAPSSSAAAATMHLDSGATQACAGQAVAKPPPVTGGLRWRREWFSNRSQPTSSRRRGWVATLYVRLFIGRIHVLTEGPC